MQNNNTPAEDKDSTQTESKSASHGAACSHSSDTPETDAMEETFTWSGHFPTRALHHARRLERERNAARIVANDAIRELDRILDTGSTCSALDLAIRFHETYERLAPQFGYETRLDTRAFDPNSKNGKLMVAVCAEILEQNAKCRKQPSTKEPRKIDWLARLVRNLVAHEEKRLNLPKQWAGTSSESIAFMFRVGPWMIDRKGIHREYRAVSKDGKIINRRWKTIYPTIDKKFSLSPKV